MKFSFKDSAKGVPNKTIKDALFVSISSKNQEEVVREGGRKTLYLKCEEKMTLAKLFMLIRKMVSMGKGAKAKKMALSFRDFAFDSPELGKLSDGELGEILGTQIPYANYEFTKYKTPPKEGFSDIKEVFVLGAGKNAQKEILKGNIIAEEVNKARTLSNTPGGDMTPSVLARAAQSAARGTKTKVRVLGEREMGKEKMRAILAVGKGSEEESKFIIMEYNGGKKNKRPVVLVGKGVTFDTGGIN